MVLKFLLPALPGRDWVAAGKVNDSPADRLAIAQGRPGHILPILCRPDVLGDPLPFPVGLRLVGWPVNIELEVSPKHESLVHAATCMGQRLLEAALGRAVGHITDFTPEEFHMQQEHLPVGMPGEDFLDGWKTVRDSSVKIESEVVYPVRAAARYAIEENDRARRMLADLRAYAVSREEALLWRMGGYLYASHESGRSLGWGGGEAEHIVEVMRGQSPSRGIYGARVSGAHRRGPSAVVILAGEKALPWLQAWAEEEAPGVGLLH